MHFKANRHANLASPHPGLGRPSPSFHTPSHASKAQSLTHWHIAAHSGATPIPSCLPGRRRPPCTPATHSASHTHQIAPRTAGQAPCTPPPPPPPPPAAAATRPLILPFLHHLALFHHHIHPAGTNPTRQARPPCPAAAPHATRRCAPAAPTAAPHPPPNNCICARTCRRNSSTAAPAAPPALPACRLATPCLAGRPTNGARAAALAAMRTLPHHITGMPSITAAQQRCNNSGQIGRALHTASRSSSLALHSPLHGTRTS